jgi:hypothetical protein
MYTCQILGESKVQIVETDDRILLGSSKMIWHSSSSPGIRGLQPV